LLGSSIAIGPGKAALLEAISETGSIAAAGRHMGMSYRRRPRPPRNCEAVAQHQPYGGCSGIHPGAHHLAIAKG